MPARKPKLTPDRKNANRGTDRGRALLEQSLRELGAGRSILVDKAGRIIAGNKTYETWQELSQAVEIIKTTGDKLIVVQREDLDLDEPHGTARRLAYYDNRTSELDLEWDIEQVLADINDGMDVGDLWSSDELDVLLQSFDAAIGDMPQLADNDPTAFETITFTVHTSQAEIIREACRMAEVSEETTKVNANSNGNALFTVCKGFLNGCQSPTN